MYVVKPVPLNSKTKGNFKEVYVCFNQETLELEVPVTAYLAHLTINEGLSKHTPKNYGSTIKRLLNEIDRDPLIESWKSISDKEMRAYIENYADHLSKISKGDWGGTLGQHVDRISMFYEWAYQNGWLENPPAFTFLINEEIQLQVNMARGKRDSLDPFGIPAKYIPKAEFKDLLSYKSGSSSFVIERNDIVLKLGYYSGLRAAECTSPDNFTIEKIQKAIKAANAKNETGFELSIVGKGRNGGKPRVIYVPEHLRRQIENFINGSYKRVANKGLLICNLDGSRLSDSHASRTFQDTVKELLKSGKSKYHEFWSNSNKTFHCLRHSYATNFAKKCLNDGMDLIIVKERLGHESISTTYVYVHFIADFFLKDEDLKSKAIKKIRASSTQYSRDVLGEG